MLYLALQTAALIFGTYFIGTFLGCLLHKFFNMLFGSKERRLATGAASVVAAAGASSTDLHLFQKDVDGNPIKTLDQKIDSGTYRQTPDTQQKAPIVKTKTLEATAKPATYITQVDATTTQIGNAADDTLQTAPTIQTQEPSERQKTQIETPQQPPIAKPEKNLNIPTAKTDDILAKVEASKILTKTKAAGVGAIGTAVAATTLNNNDEKTTLSQTPASDIAPAISAENALTTKEAKQGFFSRWFGRSNTKEIKEVKPDIQKETQNLEVKKVAKPAVTIPKNTAPAKVTKTDALDMKKADTNIVVPAVVAGTAAAAAATMAKGDNVIQTVKKMTRDVITITDPKPAPQEADKALPDVQGVQGVQGVQIETPIDAVTKVTKEVIKVATTKDKT